jgi:hypothetical protein
VPPRLSARWSAEHDRVAAPGVESPALLLAPNKQLDPGATWHSRQSREPSGPRSHLPEMDEAFRALLSEGRKFPTRKAAHRAVLERLAVAPGARGWSYNTFIRLKSRN